jgi:RNA polymerase sigma factor (sigma-70 family)
MRPSVARRPATVSRAAQATPQRVLSRRGSQLETGSEIQTGRFASSQFARPSNFATFAMTRGPDGSTTTTVVRPATFKSGLGSRFGEALGRSSMGKATLFAEERQRMQRQKHAKDEELDLAHAAAFLFDLGEMRDELIAKLGRQPANFELAKALAAAGHAVTPSLLVQREKEGMRAVNKLFLDNHRMVISDSRAARDCQFKPALGPPARPPATAGALTRANWRAGPVGGRAQRAPAPPCPRPTPPRPLTALPPPRHARAPLSPPLARSRSRLAQVGLIVRKYVYATNLDESDLVQEGNIGLLNAMRLFDPSRSVRFSTFASWHVRGTILRAIMNAHHTIRLPVRVQQEISAIQKVRASGWLPGGHGGLREPRLSLACARALAHVTHHSSRTAPLPSPLRPPPMRSLFPFALCRSTPSSG